MEVSLVWWVSEGLAVLSHNRHVIPSVVEPDIPRHEQWYKWLQLYKRDINLIRDPQCVITSTALLTITKTHFMKALWLLTITKLQVYCKMKIG